MFDDLDGHAEALGDLLREVDLEADELALLVLELPGHVADIRSELHGGRLGPRGGQAEGQGDSSRRGRDPFELESHWLLRGCCPAGLAPVPLWLELGKTGALPLRVTLELVKLV